MTGTVFFVLFSKKNDRAHYKDTILKNVSNISRSIWLYDIIITVNYNRYK